MDNHIIDCCSLLNLYTGWGGLDELRDLDLNLHICEAVFKEVEYTREYGLDGVPIMIPLDMERLNQNAIFSRVQPESVREVEDYVNLAMEIDDGEAQALAIAKHRQFVLLTDDHKAAKIASRPDVAVRTVSTTTILRAWANINTANENALYHVIQRISILARFIPRSDSPDYGWWKRYTQS